MHGVCADDVCMHTLLSISKMSEWKGKEEEQ